MDFFGISPVLDRARLQFSQRAVFYQIQIKRLASYCAKLAELPDSRSLQVIMQSREWLNEHIKSLSEEQVRRRYFRLLLEEANIEEGIVETFVNLRKKVQDASDLEKYQFAFATLEHLTSALHVQLRSSEHPSKEIKNILSFTPVPDTQFVSLFERVRSIYDNVLAVHEKAGFDKAGLVTELQDKKKLIEAWGQKVTGYRSDANALIDYISRRMDALKTGAEVVVPELHSQTFRDLGSYVFRTMKTLDKLYKHSNEVQAERDKLNDENSELRAQVVSFSDQIVKLSSKETGIEELLQGKEHHIAQQSDEIQGIYRQNDDLKAQIEGLNATLEGSDRAIRELTERVKYLENENRQADEELRRTVARYESRLRDAKQSREKIWEDKKMNEENMPNNFEEGNDTADAHEFVEGAAKKSDTNWTEQSGFPDPTAGERVADSALFSDENPVPRLDGPGIAMPNSAGSISKIGLNQAQYVAGNTPVPSSMELPAVVPEAELADPVVEFPASPIETSDKADISAGFATELVEGKNLPTVSAAGIPESDGFDDADWSTAGNVDESDLPSLPAGNAFDDTITDASLVALPEVDAAGIFNESALFPLGDTRLMGDTEVFTRDEFQETVSKSDYDAVRALNEKLSEQNDVLSKNYEGAMQKADEARNAAEEAKNKVDELEQKAKMLSEENENLVGKAFEMSTELEEERERAVKYQDRDNKWSEAYKKLKVKAAGLKSRDSRISSLEAALKTAEANNVKLDEAVKSRKHRSSAYALAALSLIAAPLSAGYLWVNALFSTPAHAQAPRTEYIEKVVAPELPDVPVETFQYQYLSDNVAVRFGDVKFEVSVPRLNTIYEAIEQDENRLNRILKPAERLEYFKLEQRLNDD